MNNRRLPVLYATFDLAGSAIAWSIFFILILLPGWNWEMRALYSAPGYINGLVIIPLSWLVIYSLTGFYHVSLKRSRLTELYYSLSVTMPGVIICFLALLFTGLIINSADYLKSLLLLFFLHFFITYIPRLSLTSSTANKVHRGLLGTNTIIIGSGGKASELLRKIREEKIRSGAIIKGYVITGDKDNGVMMNNIPCLGEVRDLQKIITDKRIEDVIIAIESDEHDTLTDIIGKLDYSNITIKAIPSLKDILTGRVEQRSIFGTPLLEIPNSTMPVWQANIKEIMDYVLAFLSLIILIPVILVLGLLIKLYDNGPVIYSQMRTGRNGKTFRMYKFRSMATDSEKDGPSLSGINDARITPVGRFMRRHRLDEIPNLKNVLRGEMSLVGPRPERQHFIDQIVKVAPHYRRLHKVKPGITSWGQVKYGYAGSIEQMVERLEFDLLYIENMSLSIDLKILIYTMITILKGKGI